MDSSVNPPSKSSNFQRQQASSQELPLTAAETAAIDEFSTRQQPIPPPSESLQYRAIGLVRGRYSATSEQFTQGTLVAADGTELNTVLLGRIISLLRNHLDLAQEHLWVVYPRMGQQNNGLHLQIVGVWEPENLRKAPAQTDLTSNDPTSPEMEDGYFSIRGEIVYQSAAEQNFIVKIKQAPRQEADKPKYFKLKLMGDLGTKAIGQFWDLQARRQAHDLVLIDSEMIAVLPSKPKLRRNKPRPTGYSSPRRSVDTPRPVRKGSDPQSITRPVPKTPGPKPIKRQKPPQT